MLSSDKYHLVVSFTVILAASTDTIAEEVSLTVSDETVILEAKSASAVTSTSPTNNLTFNFVGTSLTACVVVIWIDVTLAALGFTATNSGALSPYSTTYVWSAAKFTYNSTVAFLASSLSTLTSLIVWRTFVAPTNW